VIVAAGSFAFYDLPVAREKSFVGRIRLLVAGRSYFCGGRGIKTGDL